MKINYKSGTLLDIFSRSHFLDFMSQTSNDNPKVGIFEVNILLENPDPEPFDHDLFRQQRLRPIDMDRFAICPARNLHELESLVRCLDGRSRHIARSHHV